MIHYRKLTEAVNRERHAYRDTRNQKSFKSWLTRCAVAHHYHETCEAPLRCPSYAHSMKGFWRSLCYSPSFFFSQTTSIWKITTKKKTAVLVFAKSENTVNPNFIFLFFFSICNSVLVKFTLTWRLRLYSLKVLVHTPGILSSRSFTFLFISTCHLKIDNVSLCKSNYMTQPS